MENPFETSVEVLPAATMTPAPKPAFEAAFADILTAAKAQVEQSKKIIVTDPTDVDGIAESRKYRLAIRQIRIAGEKTRKRLKEEILLAGRAIDGMNNILLQVCDPEEARLERQEKIAEVIAAERAAKLRAEREAVLVELGENPAFHGPFERFPLEDWNQRIAGIRAVKEAQAAQAKRDAEESARKATEEAQERIRIRAENAQLKAEADAREAEMKAEREAADARQAEIKKRLDDIEAKARAESAKLAQAEAEASAKEEAEREAKRKAEAAPDQEKILAYENEIMMLRLPNMVTDQGIRCRHQILNKVAELTAWIRGKAGEL